MITSQNSYSNKLYESSSAETSVNTLAKYARAEDWQLRFNVARNPNASQAILSELACDANKVVRGGVAGNEASPVEVLSTLALDPEY